MVSQQKKEDLFIEECALLFEKNTPFPKIAGKVFSYLLICDPVYQSANQLIDKLGVAKSSISSVLHMLHHIDLIEEISIPGERSRYYQLNVSGWEIMMIKKMQAISTLKSIFLKGYNVLPSKKKILFQRLDFMNHLYTFFEEEFSGMGERWESYKKKHSIEE